MPPVAERHPVEDWMTSLEWQIQFAFTKQSNSPFSRVTKIRPALSMAVPPLTGTEGSFFIQTSFPSAILVRTRKAVVSSCFVDVTCAEELLARFGNDETGKATFFPVLPAILSAEVENYCGAGSACG